MSEYNNTTNIDDDSKRVKLILQFQEEKPCTFFLNQTLFNNLQYLTSLIILWPKEHMICNKRQIDSYHKEPMLKDSKRRALGQSRADFRIPCQFIDSRHKKYIPIQHYQNLDQRQKITFGKNKLANDSRCPIFVHWQIIKKIGSYLNGMPKCKARAHSLG